MVPKVLGHVSLRRCEGCDAVFLERAALGALVEAENDWHAHQSANTAAMPRISADMTSPPVTQPRSRAYVEKLFRD
jgi:hypothetical protein